MSFKFLEDDALGLRLPREFAGLFVDQLEDRRSVGLGGESQVARATGGGQPDQEQGDPQQERRHAVDHIGHAAGKAIGKHRRVDRKEAEARGSHWMTVFVADHDLAEAADVGE